MTSIRFVVTRVLPALVILGPVAAGLWADESAEMGELKLEGAFVEKLALTSEDGRRHKVDVSAEMVTLPLGKYRPYEVTLRGGYQCWPYQARDAEWVAVGAGERATLKMGAPLEHRIRLKRQGPLLIADYELVGQAGETYGPVRSAGKPRFVVYRNDEKIFSADFEYG
ncbi:MAG: hypothetical protein JW741_05760 [Sedimentisphaerales bacterium]|nr:hypothetical protein [Sedimentisphaerales bacterium]